MKACLQCKQSENKCKCEGGFKIIFHFGIAKSKKEMDDFNNKSELEKKISLTKFMLDANDKIAEKTKNDLDVISGINKKISKIKKP